jgi:hypothetical protein
MTLGRRSPPRYDNRAGRNRVVTEPGPRTLDQPRLLFQEPLTARLAANDQPISDDATLGLPLSVPQRSALDSRFESSPPSHFVVT